MDYQKLYNGLISKRIANPLSKSVDLYTEAHHIIPRCLGGSDVTENIIRLTGREHFIAHRLLSKIHSNNTGLATAAFLMSRLQNRKICSKEYDRLKALASKSIKAQWEDPEYREIMSSSSKQLWLNREFREMMSLGTKERCADPEFKEMMSSSAKLQWAEPIFRAKAKKAQSDWFEGKKDQPWLLRHFTKEIWSLAQVFWEHRPNNPDATEIYSVVEFCRIFNEGKNKNTFYKIHRRFNTGWIPKLDPNWSEEFGHIRY